jgi:nucleoid DNA-binding protein
MAKTEEEVNPNKIKKVYRPRVPYVKTKELIKMVSQSSGYHLYEVQDVVNHLLAHMQMLLQEQKPVKLDGIGGIRVKKFAPRQMIVPSTGERLILINDFTLAIRADPQMKRLLKEVTPSVEEYRELHEDDDTDDE